MLHLVATPIGNLSDMSYRQAQTLLASDYIYAEDTRSAHTLLAYAKSTLSSDASLPDIRSYYKDVEMDKLPEIIELLRNGMTVSLISEAGMPLISDPGYLLVKACQQNNIAYDVIPGPSAVTTALLYSGFKLDSWMFLGFLPKRKSEIEKLLKRIAEINSLMPGTLFVCFESPHRLNDTLELLNKLYPSAQVVIARELTKKYEEIRRGTPQELIGHSWKGEITILFSFPKVK